MMIQYILNIASIKLIIVNFLSLLFYSTFPTFAPYLKVLLSVASTLFGYGADFVKVAKSANYFSYVFMLLKSLNALALYLWNI